MKPPSITVLFTLNDRPIEAVRKVYESLEGQDFTELVIVFDATPAPLEEYTRGYWKADPRAVFVSIDRPKGWICPARAWNTGFARVTSEMVYCISSEVIQEPGNVAKAREILSGLPAVVYGRCVDDGPAPVVTGPHPHLLTGTEQLRPLGFIWAFPMWAVRAIGGYDEAFMDGICWEDDDIVWRLWLLGLPFIFTDEIDGVHQHHGRPQLSPEGVEKNRALIVRKTGHEHPWQSAQKVVAEDRQNNRIVCFPADERVLALWGVTEASGSASEASGGG